MELLPDRYPPGDALDQEKTRLLRRFALEQRQFLWELPAGEAADVILGQMALPVDLKQRVFELQDVRARIAALHEIVDQLEGLDAARRQNLRPPGPPSLN